MAYYFTERYNQIFAEEHTKMEQEIEGGKSRLEATESLVDRVAERMYAADLKDATMDTDE